MKEIELPRASLTSVEKSAISAGFWAERHIADQRKLNLQQAIEKAGSDPAKQKEARGVDDAAAARHAGGFQLSLLCAAVGTGFEDQSTLFIRNHDFIGYQSERQALEGDGRLTESGLAYRRRVGGLGGSLSSTGLCWLGWRRNRNFLIPTHGAGADLGRSGSADDSERDIEPVLECYGG